MGYYYKVQYSPTPTPTGPPVLRYVLNNLNNQIVIYQNAGAPGNNLGYSYFNVDNAGNTKSNGQYVALSFYLAYANVSAYTNTSSYTHVRYDLGSSPAGIMVLYMLNPANSSQVLEVASANLNGFGSGTPPSDGFGSWTWSLDGQNVYCNGQTTQIGWRTIPGTTTKYKLEPSTKYWVGIPSSSVYSSSQTGGHLMVPNAVTYPSFRTLDRKPTVVIPPTPDVVNPRVSNGFLDTLVGSNYISTVVTTTEDSAVLTSNYYYTQHPQNSESPSKLGFIYREVGSSWNPRIEIDISVVPIIPYSQRIYRTTTITGLQPFTSYEYVSYVKDASGNYFYSSLVTYPNTNYTNNQANAQVTQFKTKAQTINQWQIPPVGVSWYQLYNDWELVETSSITNRVLPYLTVRQYLPSSTAASLPAAAQKYIHTSVFGATQDFSLFRYFNKEFIKDKTYQFRTIVENFYNYRNNLSTSSKLSNFSMKTPWGDYINFSENIPYLSVLNPPSSIKIINLYLYSNINSFIPGDPTTTVPNASGITKPKPLENIISKNNPQNPIIYTANSYFNGNTFSPSGPNNVITSSGLLDVNISDSDWVIQGFSPFNIMTYTSGPILTNLSEVIPFFVLGDPIGGKGWHFIEDKGEFIWFDKYNQVDPVENSKNLPVGGDANDYYSNKTSDHKYLVNNYIYKYISYQTFNVTFDYINNSNFGISMYVGGELPNFDTTTNTYNLSKLIADGYVKKVLTLYQSTSVSGNGTTQSCEFVGVDGNQYLFFVADPVYKHTNTTTNVLISPTLTYDSTIDGFPLSSTTYSVISISNFKVSGAYNVKNNENFDVNALYSTITPILNATYSMKLGSGNNVILGAVNDVKEVNSLAGNGRFNSGIWENGVWNSGWREDLTRKEFYKIDQFYSYEKDKKWRIKISGPVSSLTDFIVGDKISISNIIAIDINEERKLLKNYYTIVEIGLNYIEVEFINDFPLRRIEMDSDEHRILVSKNVWLSGVFLNGYFKGIWNSGLFSGYPIITKMDESHWIDGIFNGGHFTANKYGTTFSAVFPISVNGVTRIGLSFTTPHKLTVDDIISINPNPYNNQYSVFTDVSLGTTVVTEVIDENKIATGINWKSEYLDINTTGIGGKIYSIISSGLIQNFDFYSNNVSKVTSLQSLKSERVFSYNSWMDVNYSNQSAVNIGKPQSILEGDTKRSYSENNLYGYPTNDILSSNSVFRDSFSTSFRKYKLGKKWKIFNDYIGDSSSFEEYFDSSDTTTGLEAFNTQGWDISVNTDNNIKLKAQSIDYPQIIGIEGTAPLNPPAQIASTSSMTMSFYNDIRNMISSNVIVDSVIIDRIWDFNNGLNIKTSKYTSNAIVKNINYNSITNITSVLLENNIVVSKLTQVISPPTINSYISSYLDKTAISYLTPTINNGLTFSRTPEPLNSNSLTIGKELKVNTLYKGGYLNLIPAYDVVNRTNGSDTQTIEKIRYSLVEFDIVDHISATTSYIDIDTGYKQPSIHFNNLNYITRNVIANSVTQSFILPATYLPISKNVNHLLTRNKKKQEFFFNKRNLLMNFKGTGVAGSFETEYYLDNIKFYQVNMIPFFQYFISPIGVQGNINRSVQIPTEGISPIIDYTEDNLIDSTNDSIITFFSNSLIDSNIEIPTGINWQRDYSIYKTQISGNDILGSDDPYITI